MPVIYVLVARIPPAGVEAFQRYEAAVLPLLAEHGGRLARRLRTDGGEVEVHLVEFASAGGVRRLPRRPAPGGARGAARDERSPDGAARRRGRAYGVNCTVMTSPSRIA